MYENMRQSCSKVVVDPPAQLTSEFSLEILFRSGGKAFSHSSCAMASLRTKMCTGFEAKTQSDTPQTRSQCSTGHPRLHGTHTLSDAQCQVYSVWCMVYGVWCVVYGVWCMVCGVWCVVYSVWCVVYRVCYVVCGVWCMVYGVWCIVDGIPTFLGS